MKKTIVILLALALLLPAGGCAPAPAPGGDAPAPAAVFPTEGVSWLAAPDYPYMAPYPDETAYLTPSGELKDEFYKAYDAWWADVRARRELAGNGGGELEDFLAASLPVLLSGNDGKNHVFSPLNLYLALGMLAEVTAGESRRQLLSLLGAEDMDALRDRAYSLWNANYRDDGATVSRLAASLWLDEKMDCIPSTLDALAEHWYASAFRGAMGSEELNAALRAWLSRETGGLLDDAVGGLETTRDTVLALAATICFRARWTDEFSLAATKTEVFHADAGDLRCDFMVRRDARTYYWGDRFAAVFLPMESGGGMWLLLPDEGVTPEELFSDADAMAFLLAPGDTENQKFLTVNLAVPKFDAASDLDLLPVLRSLGVTDVLDDRTADFSPLTPRPDGIFLAQARHAARVTIDEEGCEAAAYTVMLAAGAAMPPEEVVDFVLDRPFLFLLTGGDGAPLFAGTVHQPIP